MDKGCALSEGATRLGHEASVKDSPRDSQMGSVQRLPAGNVLVWGDPNDARGVARTADDGLRSSAFRSPESLENSGGHRRGFLRSTMPI